jgi:hypothetical protein
MYDKYSQATEITPGTTKLGKHKALLVVPEKSTTYPGVTMWAYNDQGSTFSLNMTFANYINQGPQIFPMNVYAVTEVTDGKVYRLN